MCCIGRGSLASLLIGTRFAVALASADDGGMLGSLGRKSYRVRQFRAFPWYRLAWPLPVAHLAWLVSVMLSTIVRAELVVSSIVPLSLVRA